jgi:hypothetical protein
MRFFAQMAGLFSSSRRSSSLSSAAAYAREGTS